jgi:hypothetical protein
LPVPNAFGILKKDSGQARMTARGRMISGKRR